ncbi:beta strand repeat-containing protein [Limnohabitans sp. 103DPR2]|uniref:beta strand repeat-containing protein n=1 Tax=Limnohabitans sp. 103DPR2 TaxID=1678129 RepID=UPI0006DCF68A|nr:calcium-binding protein [Limnohabitans sp. 103DPR2]ALK93227.1 Bifunctional hemolysin/adenylate cyclase precursor [Limnohabitans sp. 103DPR2]
MATVNALSVALFNAAAGGYAAEMTANASGFANAVGPILEKDISTDALFVEHLLGNLGVLSTSPVYAQAKAAVAALVTTKGRAGAASDAVDFLKAQEGTTSAYATIAATFAAKVNQAAVFTAANATERDITKLVAAVTGVDTDVVAINNAVAAQKAADDAAAAAAVAKAAADAKAAAEATAKAAADKAASDAAAALKAANDKATADATAAKAAADKAAADAATALKAAQDKAAADLTAANTAAAAAAKTAADAATKAAADAAATLKAAQDKAAADATAAKAAADKAAADAATALKAAQDKAAADLAAVDNTSYASEQAAYDAAKAAAEKAAADAAAATKVVTDAAAAKAAADLKAANDTITALQNPAGGSFALTDSIAADILIGTAGNDTFTGKTSTFSTSDMIVDGQTTDNDTLTFSSSAADVSAFVVRNVENVVFNIASASAPTAGSGVDATSFGGVKNLTVTRTDIDVNGTPIVGNKVGIVSGVDATKVAVVTAGSGTTDFTVLQATKAGVTVNADAASGDIAVTGAATLNAGGSLGTVTVTSYNAAGSAQNKKAVVVNADATTGNVLVASAGATKEFAGPITVNAAATGSVVINNEAAALTAANATAAPIVVNAAAATTVTIDDATWGATVNATSAHATSATVTLKQVSSKGTTLNLGSGSTTNTLTVNLDGTSGSTAESATIAAAGSVTVDVSKTSTPVNTLNLSSNTGTTTYTVNATNNPFTALNATGTNPVNVKSTGTILDATTITGVNKLSISAAASGSTLDLSKVAAKEISIEADFVSDAVTVANGAVLTLAADQTTSIVVASGAAGDSVTIQTGDDNGTNTTLPDLTTGTLDLTNFAAADIGTVNLIASVGKLSISTATTATAYTDIVVTGSKDVALGTVTAASVNASASTGKISLTSTTDVTKITTGSGIDTVVLNGAAVHNVTTNAGADMVDILDTSASAQISTGDGNDRVWLSDNAAIVISAGTGDDKVYVGTAKDGTVSTVATDAVIAGGTGTDTVYFDSSASTALDLSAKSNFALTGIEVLDLSALDAKLSIKASVLATNGALTLVGDSSSDTLAIVANGTTGSTIDGSLITIDSASTVSVRFETGAKKDVVTGTAGDDTITTSAGADSYDGAGGSDTLDFSSTLPTETGSAQAAGYVINLGTTAILDTTVLSATSKYIAQTLNSVAAGTAAYNFASDASSNSTVVKTIAGIENVTGSSGNDYIVGDSGNNVITGGAGADFISAGAGADTIVYNASSEGSDTISGFTVADDVIRLFDNTNLSLNGTATLGYAENTLAGLTVGAAQNVIVVTDAQSTWTSAAAIDTALDTYAAATLSGGVIVIFKTSSSGAAQIWFDAAAQTDGSGANTVQLATLTGLTDLTTLSASNFTIV